MKIFPMKYIFLYGLVCFFWAFSGEILADRLKSVVTIVNKADKVISSVEASNITEGAGKMKTYTGFPIQPGGSGKVHLQASGDQIDMQLVLSCVPAEGEKYCSSLAMHVDLKEGNDYNSTTLPGCGPGGSCGEVENKRAHNPHVTVMELHSR
jgi:hypothetical protein